jgi:hypothetical protein
VGSRDRRGRRVLGTGEGRSREVQREVVRELGVTTIRGRLSFLPPHPLLNFVTD